MTARYLLENVVRRYRPLRSHASIEALRVPRLEVAPGEILAVVGPNGSGKSTLLETMAFLSRPEEGRVCLDGRDVWASGTALSARRRCPMLLQRTVLFKTSVLKNVMYGMLARGASRTDARRKAEAVLRLVRLESLRHRAHRELSGGEKQRVALARILALEPEVLLLDEPTTYVDRPNARLIEEILRELHETSGLTAVIASHDVRQARTLADRIGTLVDGRFFPGTMDNLLEGSLHRVEEGLEFREANGLVLPISHDAIVGESVRSLEGFVGKPVQIVLEPAGIELVNGEEAGGELPRGTVEAIRREGDRRRTTVRLEAGPSMDATLSAGDYDRLRLNLGRSVRLKIGKQAVRVFGGPKQGLPAAAHPRT